MDNLEYYESESLTVPNFSGVRLHKLGRHVVLTIDSGNALTGMSNGDVLFNIPQKYRPRNDIHYATLSCNISNTTDSSGTFPIVIKTNGDVAVFVVSKPLTAKAFYGCISYFV